MVVCSMRSARSHRKVRSSDGRSIAYESVPRGEPKGPIVVQDLHTRATRGGLDRAVLLLGVVARRRGDRGLADPIVHCDGRGGYPPQVGPPVWSPDSRQLAFTSTAALRTVPAAFLHDIVVINRDGTGLHTVRHASLACAPTGGDVHDNVIVHAWR